MAGDDAPAHATVFLKIDVPSPFGASFGTIREEDAYDEVFTRSWK
jgi:hypothetical protein